MMQLLLVGVGAGAASALLFASVASGSLLSILLFYLAPLPIIIAAIGWSHWAALVAALTAALGLAAGFGSPLFLAAFLIGIGLPAWWLGYLTLLARPLEDGSVEWYPAGRLVLWCAAIAAAMVILVIPTFGTDEDSFRAGLRSAFERMLTEPGRAPATPLDASSPETQRTIDFLVAAMPLAAAAVATITNTLNLYLAARIVKVSGRLTRPWPDLAAIRFPPRAHAVFGVAILLSFMPGLVGTVGGIVTSALVLAYAVLGFAVLHTITRSMGGRGFILWGAYFALAFFWPTIILATLLGLADAIFDFRNRAAGPGQPPARTE
jgi:hypothetical protein